MRESYFKYHERTFTIEATINKETNTFYYKYKPNLSFVPVK